MPLVASSCYWLLLAAPWLLQAGPGCYWLLFNLSVVLMGPRPHLFKQRELPSRVFIHGGWVIRNTWLIPGFGTLYNIRTELVQLLVFVYLFMPARIVDALYGTFGPLSAVVFVV